MKVRIVKASGQLYWYSAHVGEIFPVREWLYSPDYEVVDENNKGEGIFIDKSDCEVVEQ